MPRETGKRPQRPEDDLSLLEQIREANPAAGAQFLEYLVLQKRSSVCHVLLTAHSAHFSLVSGFAHTIGDGLCQPVAGGSEGRDRFEAMASQRFIVFIYFIVLSDDSEHYQLHRMLGPTATSPPRPFFPTSPRRRLIHPPNLSG
jgi:ATP/maltotriose-dependent transcriptional regulator MalT